MHHDRSTEKPVLTNRQWIILTVCLIAAAVLRIFAAFNDFWLDEIWSLQFAREVDSAWDIIAETPHDNNHILNTLYLYSIGYQHNWVWYRLLAVAAGTASVALIAYISLQRGFPEAVCTAFGDLLFIIVLSSHSGVLEKKKTMEISFVLGLGSTRSIISFIFHLHIHVYHRLVGYS
jgi:hypothetical protein